MKTIALIFFAMVCMTTTIPRAQGQIGPLKLKEWSTTKPIVLDPMQEATFNLKVNPDSLLILEFEPNPATLDALKNAGLVNKEIPLRTSYAFQPDINAQLPKLPRLLEVSIKAGNMIYKSEVDQDQFLYTVKETSASLPLNGLIVVKNITKIRLAGQVTYTWRSVADQKGMDETELNSKIKKAFEETKNTDIVYLLGIMFERYLNNFPGGKGEIDQTFENTLKIAQINRTTIQKLSTNLKKYQDQVNAKVVNKNILKINTASKLEKSSILQLNLIPAIQNNKTTLGESNFIGHYKHSLNFLAIKSHRCADDEGWEPGCDQEEGYVGYYCFGPSIFFSGTTDNFGGMVRNSERFLYKQIIDRERLQVPIVFLYQVIEDDSGGPSKNEMVGAITSGIYTVVTAFSGDWVDAITYGFDAISDAIRICQALTAGPDDTYPIYINMIDEDRLKQYTLGTSAPPQDQPLFDSEGSYKGGYTIRVPKIYIGSNLQWSLVYSMRGIPVGPIAELYADANYAGAKKQFFIDGSFTSADLTPVGDNTLSSVKLLDPMYELMLYDNSNQSGVPQIIRADYSNLAKIPFDNKTSSVVIRKRSDYVYSELRVMAGSSPTIPPPDGYTKLNNDLNATVGGDYIYLCYKKIPESELNGVKPITGITVIDNPNNTPSGFSRIDVDLNKGAGGAFLYLCYKRGELNDAIKDIVVIQSRDNNVQPPSEYIKINMDLNKGAGGDFLYFCYLK